ncbi:hypothetical protein ACLN6N_08335 [Sphingomonas carotinifaciens]|uniref:hypothetical protein n=1 Tax=Sphingomonas carotinifaciens TaxID=1166323 RepID=UPI00399F7D77
MEIVGDYQRDGYALVRGLIPRTVCNALLNQMKGEIEGAGGRLESIARESPLLARAAVELYGYHYPPLLGFLWALTPTIETLVGAALLPTYDYFRIYRDGDVCRVHSDRPSCEHSLSLTLDYSDGEAWPLEVGTEALVDPRPEVTADFAGQPFASLAMEPGDAVLYRGVHRRHGRITPNPNAWSAHLFCHWVGRDGPFKAHAFDGNAALARPVNFRFG